MPRPWMTLAAIGLGLAAPAAARGEAGRCPPRCSVAELRARALAAAPALAAAEAGVLAAEGAREEAWAAPLRVTDALLELEPTAARRGDLVHGLEPDVSFTDAMGLHVQLRLYAVAPASSWWRIASLWRAAEAGVEIARGEAERQRAAVRLAVERAYLDLQLEAARSEALAEARRHLARGLAAVEVLLDEDLPGADERDRLRLEIAVADLEARAAASLRGRSRAEARLRAAAALPGRGPIVATPLAAPEPAPAPLDWYLEAARRGRPEVPMAAAGIRAGRAAVDLALGELVPDVGVAGYLSSYAAPLVDDQRSPFGHDLWNSLGAGYGLLLDWTADPVGIAARHGAARADLDRARALERLALGGVAFEVEGAFVEVEEARAGLAARARSREASQSWLDGALSDLDRGAVDGGGLAGAVRSWLDQELAYLEACRDLAFALARLESAAALRPGSLRDEG